MAALFRQFPNLNWISEFLPGLCSPGSGCGLGIFGNTLALVTSELCERFLQTFSFTINLARSSKLQQKKIRRGTALGSACEEFKQP